MARIFVTNSTTAMEAAAKVIAAAVRVQARVLAKSSKIPEVVRSYLAPGGRDAFVSAGQRGGKWGWTPIHAWMFDPNDGSERAENPMHPLFAQGPRKGTLGPDGKRHVHYGWKHWYRQPHRPFLEAGAEAGIDQAMKVYADISIAQWCRQAGFK